MLFCVFLCMCKYVPRCVHISVYSWTLACMCLCKSYACFGCAKVCVSRHVQFYVDAHVQVHTCVFEYALYMCLSVCVCVSVCLHVDMFCMSKYRYI